MLKCFRGWQEPCEYYFLKHSCAIFHEHYHYLVVPLEGGCDGEPHSEDGACDWLDAGVQLEAGQLVDTPLHDGSHLHMVQQVT